MVRNIQHLLLILTLLSGLSAQSSELFDRLASKRNFIAHRGVNLRSTIAGENSLEAIDLTRRAGFDAIETDIRLSSDDSLVVMHDATLNRTCLTTDGQKITEETPVASLTWKQLRNDYKLKADDPQMQSKIPSLTEYLERCKENNLIVFIEPKLVDPTGRYYRRIMKEADRILGRGNYIITSNNRANDIIRDSMHINDIPLMGILYQTTYDHIKYLGNVIMAISTTRFSPDSYKANVARSKQEGYLTESHSDKFPQFDMINRNGINIVSTDFLVPDNNDDRGETLYNINQIEVKKGSPLTLNYKGPKIDFGALYLEFSIEGKAEITLGKQKFTVENLNDCRHQIILYNTVPRFSISTESESVTVKNLKLKLIKY